MVGQILLVVILALASSSAVHAQHLAKAIVFPQLGHSDTIDAVAFSPDGKLLASAGSDNVVKIWDIQTRRELGTLRGHSGTVKSLTFLPDGEHLISAGFDRTIKAWSLRTWSEEYTIHVKYMVDAIAVSPDSKILVSCADANAIDLWATDTGNAIASFGKADGFAICHHLAFSPDGKMLALAASNNSIRLVKASSGELIEELKGHAGPVNDVAFGPSGQTLVSASDDATVKLWDIASAHEIRTFGGLGNQVNAVGFSRDGETVLGVTFGDSMLWEASSGKQLASQPRIGGLAGAFSFDGKEVAVADGRAVRLLNGSSLKLSGDFTRHSSGVSSVVFWPDDASLVVPSFNGNGFRTWDTASGKLRPEIRGLGYTSLDAHLAISRDGTRFAAVDDFTDGVRLWKSLDQEPQLLDGSECTNANDDLLCEGHSLAFSPNGKIIAWAGWGPKNQQAAGFLELFDVGTGQRTLKIDFRSGTPLEMENDAPLAVAISADGGRVAAGSLGDGVKVWDAHNGQELMVLKVPESDPQFITVQRVDAVDYSADGRWLAAGTWSRTVEVWDAKTGKHLATLSGHEGPVLAVRFSPNGKVLASGGFDSSIKLWDPQNGALLHTLVGHIGQVRALAFSPDGKVLASASADGTVREWDVATGRERAALIAFNDGSAITVAPEGYFDSSSPQAEENLNVRIGARVYGISSFRENFYRPDLVTRSLAGESLAGLGSLDDVKLSPIVDLADEPSSITEPKLKVNLKLEKEDGGVGPVRVFWNGSAILQDSTGDPNALSRRYTIPLPSDASGDNNELRVTVQNAEGSMWSEAIKPVSVKLAAPEHPKGKLFALVVGIDQFPKLGSAFALNYSGADAKLIKTQLETYSKGAFDDVRVTLLSTPEETAKGSIVNAVGALKKELGPDDTFVLYFVSHGAVLKNGEYYLLTSDTGSSVKDAISRRELSGLLADLPTTKKIAFIDACYAGALNDPEQAVVATRGMSDEVAATVLSRDLGVDIVMAGSVQEKAQEGFNHQGLFTWVVAQGLAGEAIDPKGLVTSQTLSAYVAKKVAEISQVLLSYKQEPTSVAPEKQQPFPITKVSQAQAELH